MFRGVTNVILMLGILLCPLYCGETRAAASDAAPCQSSESGCGCGCERSTGGEQNGPTPCHDGCVHDCICKGFLKEHGTHLLASAHFWLPVCGGTSVALLAPPELSTQTVGLHSLPHRERASGAAIRLAIASLLL